jgi:O-antigen biosynthesis protein WbqP
MSLCLMIKRTLDLLMSLTLIIALLFLILAIGFLIKMTSDGPILYWSSRVGKNNILFKMPKFRTMYLNTPNIATHLLQNPNRHLTLVGTFLRKTSLDEIPQLWSILKGDMSFVGPRPALFNQYDLIRRRTLKGVHLLIPGLTGWAQVNGRDKLSTIKKVYFDEEYLKKKSFIFDLKILYLTFIKTIQKEGVRH